MQRRDRRHDPSGRDFDKDPEKSEHEDMSRNESRNDGNRCDVVEKESKSVHREEKATKESSESKVENVPAKVDNKKQPKNSQERNNRSAKLSSRFSKQKIPNGETTDNNEVVEASVPKYEHDDNAMPPIAPTPLKNAWEKPLTSTLQQVAAQPALLETPSNPAPAPKTTVKQQALPPTNLELIDKYASRKSNPSTNMETVDTSASRKSNASTNLESLDTYAPRKSNASTNLESLDNYASRKSNPNTNLETIDNYVSRGKSNANISTNLETLDNYSSRKTNANISTNLEALDNYSSRKSNASSHRSSPQNLTKDDKISLDGTSIPCKTMIFENTNLKSCTANDYSSIMNASSKYTNSYDASAKFSRQKEQQRSGEHQRRQQQTTNSNKQQDSMLQVGAQNYLG